MKSRETILVFDSEWKRQPWEGPEHKAVSRAFCGLFQPGHLPEFMQPTLPVSLSGFIHEIPVSYLLIYDFVVVLHPSFLLFPHLFIWGNHIKGKNETLDINSMKREFTVSLAWGGGGHKRRGAVIHSWKCDSYWVSQVQGGSMSFIFQDPCVVFLLDLNSKSLLLKAQPSSPSVQCEYLASKSGWFIQCFHCCCG